jgi:hypothetical protein
MTSGLPQVSVPVLSKAISLNSRQPFKRIAGADQNAEFCCITDPGHDCGRGGENESAGAENDKDGDGADDFTCCQPVITAMSLRQ